VREVVEGPGGKGFYKHNQAVLGKRLKEEIDIGKSREEL